MKGMNIIQKFMKNFLKIRCWQIDCAQMVG
jgi:hypothetical protein